MVVGHVVNDASQCSCQAQAICMPPPTYVSVELNGLIRYLCPKTSAIRQERPKRGRKLMNLTPLQRVIYIFFSENLYNITFFLLFGEINRDCQNYQRCTESLLA